MENLTDRILVETTDGFDIHFTALVDHLPIDDGYMEKELVEQTIEDVESGDLVHFCAMVTASKNGIELASEYLGGCFYKTYEEFYGKYKNDYYADMKATVIKEAKEQIKSLCEA